MDGNVLITQSPVALQYWNILKNLSDNIKMDLAARMSLCAKSILTTNGEVPS